MFEVEEKYDGKVEFGVEEYKITVTHKFYSKGHTIEIEEPLQMCVSNVMGDFITDRNMLIERLFYEAKRKMMERLTDERKEENT